MFPELTTDRFRLREILPSDQQKIFEGLSDKSVIKYYGVSYSTFKEARQQMDWYKNLIITQTGIWWGICSKDNEEMVGACGFNNTGKEHKKTELGYWLLPHYWKQGIMIEVIPSIINYAFDILALHRIEATVEIDNLSSKKLLGKLGFKYEGTLKECEFKNEKFIDLNYYALLNSSHNI